MKRRCAALIISLISGPALGCTAAKWGKGLYVLVRTSNPGAKDLQDARLEAGSDGGLVYERMAATSYWLLDPAGKIVGKVHEPDEMAALLAERLK